MIHYVVENNKFQEDGHASLVEALRDLPNSIVTLVRVIPFTHEIEPLEGIVPVGDEVVFVFGSTTLMKIAKERGWLCFTDNLDARSLFTTMGALCTNIDGYFAKLGDVSFADKAFVRPVCDDKAFAGQLFTEEEWLQWKQRLESLSPEDNSQVNLDTEVLVSSPKKLLQECRFWVVDGNIATGSTYRSNGRPQRMCLTPNHDSWVFVDQIVRKEISWHLESSPFVVDVALVDGAIPYWSILETNCLSGAGLYAADTKRLTKDLHLFLYQNYILNL